MAGDLIGYKLKDERGSFSDPRVRTTNGKAVHIHAQQVILLSDLKGGKVPKGSFMEKCVRSGGLLPVTSGKKREEPVAAASIEEPKKEMPEGAKVGPPPRTAGILNAQELQLKTKAELIQIASKYYEEDDLKALNKAELTKYILEAQVDDAPKEVKKAKKTKKVKKSEE